MYCILAHQTRYAAHTMTKGVVRQITAVATGSHQLLAVSICNYKNLDILSDHIVSVT